MYNNHTKSIVQKLEKFSNVPNGDWLEELS